MRRSIMKGSAAVCLGALIALGGASIASAHDAGDPTTTVPNAPVSTTSTTLPLFGAPLTVDVTVGAGGTLTSVTVNQADTMTATKVKPNKVAFVNDTGTAKVVVSTRHGSQGVTAKAGTLADISGPGSWAGDVFGSGANTTVAFEIAATAEGAPDIVNVSSSDPTAVIGEAHHDGWGDKQHASVAVKFTSGVQGRVLWISAAVGNRHGESQARLSIWLSDIKGLSLPADQVAGAHTWNGILCDGTAASIAYNVATDGAISDVTPTPATAEVKARGDHAVVVKFSRHESVSIKVKGRDGQLKISADEKFRCGRTDPTVNTPIAPSATDHDDEHDHEHDNHDGDSRDGGWDHKGH